MCVYFIFMERFFGVKQQCFSLVKNKNKQCAFGWCQFDILGKMYEKVYVGYIIIINKCTNQFFCIMLKSGY